MQLVSDSGWDYQPDYLELSELNNYYMVPVLCLSSNASPERRADVLQIIDRDPARVMLFSMPLHQYTPRYIVVEKGNNPVENMVHQIRKQFHGQQGIIYCHSKAEAAKVANKLKIMNILADHYDTDRDVPNREDVQDGWMRGNCQVIVATDSFGAGINNLNC